MQLRGQSVALALLSSPYLTSAFYLPGVAPTSYKPGDKVPLNVNRLTASVSQADGKLYSAFAYDYYNLHFGFCVPEGGPEDVSESLGSILFGDRIQTSPFELKMKTDESCKAVCGTKTVDAKTAKWINRRIEKGFNLNWLIDGLPAGQLTKDEVTDTEFYSQGFALGKVENKTPQLNNHFDIIIDYHELNPQQMRVVGVIVQPSSRKDTKVSGSGGADCGSEKSAPLVLSETGATEVTWTYSVFWLPSKTAWATRWDKYLHVFDPKIHWFSLINSSIIVCFLCGMVFSILWRALKKDFARYNRLDQISLEDFGGTSVALEDGVQEDSGWKLVHGDVFRIPKNPLVLSVFLGNGVQLFVMTALTIIFALLGFLSPSNRGSLGTIMILLYTVFGFVGGYVSTRSYKAFGGESWTMNMVLTPLLVPGIVYATFFSLNLFLWAKQASGAVPFTTMVVVVCIWFLISVPLSLTGSWVALKKAAYNPPVKTNQIPRQIPPSSTYLRTIPSMFLVGLLPFGAIFVELYFIMSSIWFSKVYYMFGFLFLCYVLMIITCAAVTVLMVYFLLCSENYHWQWRAFFTAGASAGYVFAYALIYWVSKLEFGSFAGSVLYVGYSALLSFLFFILTGTIGYFASWAFVDKIYGSIKID